MPTARRQGTDDERPAVAASCGGGPGVASGFVLRDVTDEDLPSIAEIFDHHVVTSTATFETRVLGVAPWREKIDRLRAAGWPFLVAVDDGRVVGFAYAAPWRARPAYARTVEETIYLSPDATGRGWGRTLLTELLERVRAAGGQVVVAVISDVGAEASVALHRRLGFRQVGHLQGVGEKFGRRLGTYLWQRDLTPRP